MEREEMKRGKEKKNTADRGRIIIKTGKGGRKCSCLSFGHHHHLFG